jgi:hypothetical protein
VDHALDDENCKGDKNTSQEWRSTELLRFLHLPQKLPGHLNFVEKTGSRCKVKSMSADAQPDKLSRLVAEEVLRTIYGDDFAGCKVSLDDVATVVHDAMLQRAAQDRAIVETYEAVIVSLHQLSTPPEAAKVTSPDELRTLLGQRLDAIRAITGKAVAMAARVKAQRSGKTLPENPELS